MIRDPSDGTVRATCKESLRITSVQSESPFLSTTSGLPTDKLKADEIARLEKSRDWMRERFNRRADLRDSENAGED